MTVSTAPRMTPRIVNSLIFSPARSAWSRAIESPLYFRALARRSRRGMAADCAPAPLIEHPYVGQQHAILDDPVEIFNAPFRLDRADHHLIERRRVAHLELDGVDLAPLDRVEPLIPMHHEPAGRAATAPHEIGL